MSINNIPGINHDQIKDLAKNQNIKQVITPHDTSEEEGKQGHGDVVEISGNVEKLQSALSDLKSEIMKISDVRQNKIEEVENRLESGFYDDKAIIGKVASSIRSAVFAPLV